MKKRLPDFLIIGAMKSGTTSLYHYLIRHPKIIPASRKEIHFFDVNFNKGISWYKSRFPLLSNSKADCLTGEASPYYMFHPHAPRRICRTLPQGKLIVILRNPVDRAYSQYGFIKGIKASSFEKAIQKEKKRINKAKENMLRDENFNSSFYRRHSYLSRGIYVDQLRAFKYYFRRNQILVLKSEDFFENPQHVLNRVCRFLELPKHNFTNFSVFNRRQYSSMDPSTRKELVEFFKPHNKRLYKFLDEDFGWD